MRRRNNLWTKQTRGEKRVCSVRLRASTIATETVVGLSSYDQFHTLYTSKSSNTESLWPQCIGVGTIANRHPRYRVASSPWAAVNPQVDPQVTIRSSSLAYQKPKHGTVLRIAVNRPLTMSSVLRSTYDGPGILNSKDYPALATFLHPRICVNPLNQPVLHSTPLLQWSLSWSYWRWMGAPHLSMPHVTPWSSCGFLSEERPYVLLKIFIFDRALDFSFMLVMESSSFFSCSMSCIILIYLPILLFLASKMS